MAVRVKYNHMIILYILGMIKIFLSTSPTMRTYNISS